MQYLMPTGRTIAALLMLATLACHTSAQAPAGIGERASKQAYSLVAMAELSRYASRQPSCSGTRVVVYDSSAMVDSEVAPFLRALVQAERRSLDEVVQMVTMLKALPSNRDFGAQVIARSFDQKIDEARRGYGEESACAAVVSGINVAVGQLQTWFRDMTQVLKAPRQK